MVILSSIRKIATAVNRGMNSWQRSGKAYLEREAQRKRELVEQDLALATKTWSTPLVARVYKTNDVGRALLQQEAEILARHRYEALMQTEDGGHVHVGRLLATGGLSIFAGRAGIRSKGILTVTFRKVEDH